MVPVPAKTSGVLGSCHMNHGFSCDCLAVKVLRLSEKKGIDLCSDLDWNCRQSKVRILRSSRYDGWLGTRQYDNPIACY